MRILSVVAKIRARLAIEQSASEPPIPKPIVSKPEFLHVNVNDACAEAARLPGPTGLTISIEDHPAPLGIVVSSTVHDVVWSYEPGPVKFFVPTGDTSPSLLTHLNETVPLPPSTVIRLWKTISIGQAAVGFAGSAVTSRPTTRNPAEACGLGIGLAAAAVVTDALAVGLADGGADELDAPHAVAINEIAATAHPT